MIHIINFGLKHLQQNKFVFLIHQSFFIVLKKICKIIAQSIASNHASVCEAALTLWKSDDFTSLLCRNVHETFPILVPEVFHASQFHWCAEIKQLSSAILRVLNDINEEEFNNQIMNYSKLQNNRSAECSRKGLFWIQLADRYLNTEENKTFLNMIQPAYYIDETQANSISPESLKKLTAKTNAHYRSDTNILVSNQKKRKKIISGDKSKLISIPKTLTTTQPRMRVPSRPSISSIFSK